MGTIFVPVVCPRCKRTTGLEFSIDELKRSLSGGSSITLHCSYDDLSWTAAPPERLRMLQLCQENARVARYGWFRLRENTDAFHSPAG